MFKPLDAIARRTWEVFDRFRLLLSKTTKATINRFQRQHQEIDFEEKQLNRVSGQSKIYVLQQLDQRKKRLEEEEKQFFTFQNLIDELPKGQTPVFYFDKLIDILQKMGRTEEAIDIGKIYTFRYIAKTPGWYDVHPVSVITQLNAGRGYLKGYNFHWERHRNYIQEPIRTYAIERIQSQFYHIKQSELEYILKIPSFYPILIPSKK